jgi:hypothetical protein
LGPKPPQPLPARFFTPQAQQAARTANPNIVSTSRLNPALWMTGLLIFSHFGRPFELVLVGLHIPAIICSIGIVIAVLLGAWKRLGSPSGMALSILVCWMCISAPLSTWRTGSLTYVFWYIAFWVVLMLMVAHTPRSAKDIARLGILTGLSCLFSIILAIDEREGRLALSGTFSNSDDLALLAGYAIPFVILMALQFKNGALRVATMVIGPVYLLSVVLRTATRAAIPALLLMLVVYCWRAKLSQKVMIGLAALAAGGAMLIILPKTTLDRLSTITDSINVEEGGYVSVDGGEAMASTMERRDLLKDAIQMTLDHPLLGVGPGEYPDYRRQHFTYANGNPKHGIPSHNTFAQIASETGFPGLFFYLAFLFSIYRTAYRVRKLTAISNHPNKKLFSQISTCIEAALVYFSACAFFMTCDRHPHQFVIAGMAIAMQRLLLHWLSQQTPAPAVQSYIAKSPVLRPQQAPRYPSPVPAR